MIVKKGKNWTLQETSRFTLGKKFSPVYIRFQLQYSFSIVRTPGSWPEESGKGLTETPVQVIGNLLLKDFQLEDVVDGDKLNFPKLVFITETNRDYPATELVNETFWKFICTHPWFSAEVHGLTHPEASRLRIGQEKFGPVWYWWHIERKIALPIGQRAGERDAQAAPQRREPPDKEDHLFRGYQNGTPYAFTHTIPLMSEGGPHLATLGGCHRSGEGKWVVR